MEIKEKQNKRYRQVKKWGSSLVLVLPFRDCRDIGVKEGDWTDLNELTFLSDSVYKMTQEEKE